ncbi:hypothetical protein [Streptomyces cellostaticus]|uniref:hypothetical protein n=1 Tax=Streptomyces cellostaticus TaxID=67285 RepID=UPI0020268525|nr:hypothetical protein [Streptomyces cellostaticus]
MGVEQLPGRVREFAEYLDGLLGRLDQDTGWCAVFWQRDPEGMGACLQGRELPPWDVLESLLQDLASAHGAAVAAAERERARPLHAAAVSAYDALPGARDALGDRIDVMLREQRYAAERRSALTRRLTLTTSREETEALRLDLAWTHDDHDRAAARCAELRTRLSHLDAGRGPASAGAQPAGPVRRAAGPRPGAYRAGGAPDSAPAAPAEGAAGPRTPATAPDPAPPPARARRRRRGGARFAGAAEDAAAPVAVPPQAAVGAAPEASAGRRSPRGARFAGAEPEEEPAERSAEVVDEAAGAAVNGVVERLLRLRAEGRTGEAHVLLVETAHWPAARLPLVADGLRHAGLGADWDTLLWEAAALPADRLVAAAGALEAAGRVADGRQMLRQGVARPAAEIGAAVLELAGRGRDREVRALLDAYVRVRPPEEAARSAAADPDRLVPLLLEAAGGASEERHWDLVHALRVAGFTP